ncbi:hypothetical protein HH303_17570 [Rhodospirillaceae bacterium KN72]|uniref:Tetratricopeptide repeat protein n=1 Tax=Pacificispira spongiicola TaxID=2729598 RepID=A0A7Y0E318_9PROT|nr:hypothetical protein [Pacificispira spongiicola]NMM46304.1 hypothetical protein [Pacificispira spongiicola]
MRCFLTRAVPSLLMAPLLVAAIAVSAWAQDAVRIRAWQHSDFARIVFDWPVETGYTATISGSVLTVRFDRALQADLAAVRERLGDYITQAEIDAGGQEVRLTLTGPMTLGDFRNDNSIVVDLRKAAGQAVSTQQAAPTQQATAPQQAAQPAQPAATATAPLAGTLGIRVGEHPGYTRIVFDWPQAPGYTATKDGRALTVDFGRGATIDVAAFEQTLPAGIRVAQSTTTDAGLRLVLAVPDVAQIRHFPLEEKVVVDVLADDTVRNTAAAPLPVESVPPLAESQAAPQSSEPTPEPTSEPAAETPTSEPAPLTEEQQLAAQDRALAGALQSGQIEFREGLQPNLQVPPPPPDGEAAAQEAPQREAIPAPEASASEPPADETQVAEDAAAAQPAPQVEPAIPAQMEEVAPAGPALVTYNFQWTEDVGAAVFRRNDNIWIVFDEGAPLELSPLRTEGAPLIERLDQLPIGGATVLRLSVPDRRVNASARREGFNWVVEFRRNPQKPAVQALITADVTSEIGPHLVFPSERPGAALNVPDPEMGDTMRVATFLESGMGIDGLRRYPEFELLPTAQGVALIRLSDTVLLERNFDGFQVSAPDGLAISAVSPEAPVSSGPLLSSRRLFDLAGWMRGPAAEYSKQWESLFRSLAEVPDEKINAARIGVAGFLMAHDRGQEALGVLRVVEESDKQFMGRPENVALKGAASVLANRYPEARDLLADPRLDGFAEAAIWRGAALAEAGDYLAASDAFKPGDSLLSRYPYPVKGVLGLLRIDTAFANRDIRAADSWIKSLEQDRGELTRSQQAALDYQRGRLAIANTDFDLGEELFNDVMTSGDRKYAYRAELALISLGLRQGFMTDEEALERMERLRYAWRGDRSELHLLRRLGELYLDQPDYFEGLEVYRTAVKYFPGDPVADDLAGEMVDTFKTLFLDGGADDMDPLRSLALYEEFKELTPTGSDGDKIIENIADRLASLDLLTEAAAKLQELLSDEDRLPPGEERVRLSSKLALIYLLDDQPTKAEEALAAGRRGLELFDLDDRLEADRDRLLARAKFQQGEYDAAIKELAGDVSTEADLIRRDLYRKTENWQESAKVLQRLAGNPPTDPSEGVEGERGRYIIGWAVALFQNNDKEGLRDLVDIWGPTMANSSLSGVFDFITDPDQAPTGGDVLATVDQLIDSERFDAFLKAYRDRLFAPPEPPSAEVSASSS